MKIKDTQKHETEEEGPKSFLPVQNYESHRDGK